MPTVAVVTSELYAKRAFPYPFPHEALAREWIRAVAEAPDDPKAPFIPRENTIPLLTVGPPTKPEVFYTPTWKQLEGHLCPVRNLLWGGRAGCIAGDTVVRYKRGARSGGRSIRLDHLYRKFNGLRGRDPWLDMTCPTYMPSLGDDGVIFYNRVVDVFESGVQAMVRVDYTDGTSLRATPNHPVMTPNGFVFASELREGGRVLARASMRPQSQGGRDLSARPPRVIVNLKYHPYGAYKCVEGLYEYTRVARARLVVEAALNGLSYEDFVHILKHDAVSAAALRFLPPDYEVHHADENTLNDVLDNLDVLSKAAHARLHAQKGNLHFDSTRELTIARVSRAHDEMTYDVQMSAPANNFAANNVIVHNTGKSHWLRMDGHLRCLARPKFRALLLRRNMTELRDTHLDKLTLEAETLGAVYRASETTIVYPNGSRFRFGHCDDDNALKHYLSSEFDLILLDEGATFTEFQARWIQSRLRTLKSSGIVPMVRIGSNPGAMWLVDYYIDKTVSEEHDPSYEPKDYHFIPATITDNPHVNLAEQELRLNGLPSEALRRMYRDGDWHAIEGQFFTDWKPTIRDSGKPWHVIPELPRMRDGGKEKRLLDVPWIEIVRSIDWGFAYEQPGVVGWYACLPGGCYIKFKEEVFHNLTPSQLAKKVKTLSAGMKVRYTVGDPVMGWKREGESISETLGRHGVPVIEADNDRINGWVRLHSLLMSTYATGEDPDDPSQMRVVPTLQILGSPDPSDPIRASGCPYTVRTFPMAKMKPLDPGDLELNQDHALDDTRYFAMSRPSESRKPKDDAWAKFPPYVRKALMAGRGEGRVLGQSSVRGRRSYAR